MTSRNAKCSCGSGRKYKNCCGASTRKIPPEILAAASQSEAERRRKFQLYGAVRPIVHADLAGRKFIAVGSKLHHSDQWGTFLDFLIYFLRRTFGFTWGKKQFTQPPAERHPIVHLSDAVSKFFADHKKDEQSEFIEAPANGRVMTYFALAYDLYVVSNTLLQPDTRPLLKALLKRLRSREQFQGARYELAVLATMIRANFEIIAPRGADRSKKHPEFLARDRNTGELLAIEAKSKHRSGVLGYPGTMEEPDELKLGIRGLFKDALQQAAGHPLVIFLDLNLPPGTVYEKDMSAWYKEVQHVLEKEDANFNRFGIRGSAFNLLLMTNYPHHYGLDSELAPAIRVHFVQPIQPLVPLRNPSVLEQVVAAAQQYGNIPRDFE